MVDRNTQGHVEVICGPMFSGKTEELIKRLRRAQIARQRMSGKLKLTSHDAVKCIFFDAGVPTAAYSTLKTDLLGAWLVQRGHITHAQLDDALAITRVPARPLGQTLIEARHLTSEQLDAALVAHLETRVREAVTWRDGWYEFFEGVFPPRRVDGPPVALPELVVEELSRHLPVSELEAIFHRTLLDAISSPPSDWDAFIADTAAKMRAEVDRLRKG